jgi:putative ABC transport system ATP-binding protein/lipoprotein-releasing system ATP-binding protein
MTGVVAQKVCKVIGDPAQTILTDVSLSIQKGEFVSLVGRSGSGKSTLLYVLSGLDFASSGTVHIEDHDIYAMTPEELGQLRNQKIGFVFQFHYLLDELTALENVLMPTRKTHQEQTKAKIAEHWLTEFGLGEKLHRLPRQLSGGEQQRVAIARALIMEPAYLFADEPTGALDSVNGKRVMEILKEIHKKQGMTIVLVTHDEDFARDADRQIHLADGRVVV